MGGCRCTYKNCTLRTDGVTHMFHYPVFDKVRCHQWLTNAQKLEFLNLKVSQLKNRVVCQHHFKDDNFMNFLKDKLTFDAVPTLDGPYCDSSQTDGKKPVQDESKLYTISLEDIENEYLTFNDKKANFSVKYGDFLTNCDLMDLDSMNLTNDTQIILKDKGIDAQNSITLNENIDCLQFEPPNPILNKTLDILQSNNSGVLSVIVTEVPVDIDGNTAKMTIPNVGPPPAVPNTSHKATNMSIPRKPKEPVKRHSKSLLKEKKKITILDEQSIKNPGKVPFSCGSLPVSVPLPINLEPVCPSAVLTLNNKKRNFNMNLRNRDNNMHNDITKTVVDKVEHKNVEEIPVILENTESVHTSNVSENQNCYKNVAISDWDNQGNSVKASVVSSVPIKQPQKIQNQVRNITNGKKPNPSLIKNRIPPERMAAIEEKRKFNMKLRDIIASCLDKLDDEESKNYDNCKLKSKIEKNITQKVSSYLSNEPERPGIHDYTVAYLEARMQRMENILLNKIDQNSQRIMDLKQLLTPRPDKKVAHTQTLLNEEHQKKHLYQEISKFLSPAANSLLFEELFINKYAQKIPQNSPTKKRKYR